MQCPNSRPTRPERLQGNGSGAITCRDAAAEGVVPGRQFVRGQRLEHVELVTIRVGHDHPAHVALADADLPGDFGVLVGGAQIQVEPVPDGLARSADSTSASSGWRAESPGP
jgi:hypothetical protein